MFLDFFLQDVPQDVRSFLLHWAFILNIFFSYMNLLHIIKQCCEPINCERMTSTAKKYSR